jgi:hypothetical protein
MELKKNYVNAELDVVKLDSLDVITTSGESTDYVDKDPSSWDGTN